MFKYLKELYRGFKSASTSYHNAHVERAISKTDQLYLHGKKETLERLCDPRLAKRIKVEGKNESYRSYGDVEIIQTGNRTTYNFILIFDNTYEGLRYFQLVTHRPVSIRSINDKYKDYLCQEEVVSRVRERITFVDYK